ncbi:PRC-barrel [Oceaniovalibus guishaninsula JLT2003]|uniref:PRC-barrel n=1 Tax=Oceaniovalibus guishaninsula JLT2003 TaxID=1231392 RepID=K2HCX9_9RHOB|nr:PRC-barrel domain-containing protein [Oceaniovalibus guishaninsula]EKE45278.1 PRC-barrel [Oceaniovalibus guishaninsula JLT2003]
MRFLATTAVALTVAATGAMAQDVVRVDPMTMEADALYSMQGQLIRTRDITGGDIYTSNEAHDEMSWGYEGVYDGVGADWNDIGDIEDIILSTDGQMIGVVAEIGGFLDIGDKHVMIPLKDVSLVPVDDANYALITRYNEEQLEQLPGIDEGWWD